MEDIFFDTMNPQNNETTDKELDYTFADGVMQEIIWRVQEYFKGYSPQEIEYLLQETYLFAREAHSKQIRKSGEPYINHPVMVAKILLSLRPDLITLQSALLHDVIEDTEYTQDDIEKKFGTSVAEICQWLSKLSAIKYRWEERTIGSLRKMLFAMVDDLRVIIVKLADRLHNMSTLHHIPKPEKRERIALETLNIYAPIADRLGMYHFKEELETFCLKNLYPQDYKRIKKELLQLQEEQYFFMNQATSLLKSTIEKYVDDIDISYRIKAPMSIYKKLVRKWDRYGRTSDLFDLFAVRIITDNIRHCYEILWVLHNIFIPVPKRFKDYIALPKENWYQSLHTTIIGLFPELRSQPTEIQIRTHEMHEVAEMGIAAHFSYSESGKSENSKDSYWVKSINKIIQSADEWWLFMNSMKVNIFHDQVFIFTPAGDVITLPKGSTPIDFAYAIHSKVGHTFGMARINGKIVPIDYVLRNGETVEIITQKDNKPRPLWLSIVKTAKAKEYIRQHINRSERQTFIEKGRVIFNEYLQKYYGKTLDKDLSLLKVVDGNVLDTVKKEDILVQIWNLSRKPSSVMKAIQDDIIVAILGKHRIKHEKAKPKKESSQDKKQTASKEIYPIFWSEKNIPYRIAKCCTPTKSDTQIVSVIGKWIATIHQKNCGNLKKVSLDRIMPVHWSHMPESTYSHFKIAFIAPDAPWILMKITKILYDFWVSIRDLNLIHSGELVKSTISFEVNTNDHFFFEKLSERLKFTIPDIQDIQLLSKKRS